MGKAQEESWKAADGLLFLMGFCFPGLLHWVMTFRVSAICFAAFAVAMWICGGPIAGVAAHGITYPEIFQ